MPLIVRRLLYFVLVSSSVTTINLQGCVFVPDGANLALSSKSLIFSSGIESGLNFLILLRILIASLTSITTLLLLK